MAFELFSFRYLGSTLEQYVLFFASIVIALVAAKVLYFFINKYGAMITSRTATEFDDMVLEAIEKPLLFAGFIVGFAFGFGFLTPQSDAVLTYAEKTIHAFIILDLAWLAFKLVDGFLDKFLLPFSVHRNSNLANQIVPLLRKISKILIVLVTLAVILSSFGIDIFPVIAGLGIGGLAIAFAAQKTVEDVFGGISIFTSRPFAIGDTIRAKGIEGNVEAIGLRHTRVRDYDGRIIIMPNGMLAQDLITNISAEPAKRSLQIISLKYNTSSKKLENAMEIFKKIITEHKDCEHKGGNAPAAMIKGFGQSGIEIILIFFTKDKGNFGKIASEINLELKRRFEKAGIEFALPSQSVYIESFPGK